MEDLVGLHKAASGDSDWRRTAVSTRPTQDFWCFVTTEASKTLIIYLHRRKYTKAKCMLEATCVYGHQKLSVWPTMKLVIKITLGTEKWPFSTTSHKRNLMLLNLPR